MDAEYYMGAPYSNIENVRPYIYYDVYEENPAEEIVLDKDDSTEEIVLVEKDDKFWESLRKVKK